jgi:hypothetical protein
VSVRPIKETNMAVTEKDVTISVSDRTITVTIKFPGAPNYDPLTDSIVTVTHPDGTKDTLSGVRITGGAQFQDKNLADGTYDVSVVCTDASFGKRVTVPGTTSVKFNHTVM